MSYRSTGSLLTALLFLLLANPAPAFEPSAIQVEPLARSAISWNGTALPAYPAGQPEVTVLRIRVAPGARLPLHKHPLCADCRDFLHYAFARRLGCPLEVKPACKHCHVHCFKPVYRQKVRDIMRFSGQYLIRRGRLDLLWRYFF